MKQKKESDAYPFIVRPLPPEDGGGYLIEYPDLPGVISDGDTPEEAIRNGRDALRAALRTMKQFGDPIPSSNSFSSSGQWRQRVPKSLHARLVQRASQEGVSLNTLVTSMIAEVLGKRDAKSRER